MALHKEQFQTVIDAIEIYEPFITPLHRYIYDNIYIGDANAVVSSWQNRFYDFTFLGDVIEHFEHQAGQALLSSLLRMSKYVCVVTPMTFFSQTAHHGNTHEEHLSFWGPKDFGGSLLDYQAVGPSGVYLLGSAERPHIPGFGSSPVTRLRRLARFLRDEL